MEMHQVRYFLAVARTLNFTRAAEDCNVTQPSLTRAIKQLEGELGGDLFRRERPQAQLTELGHRMLPLLKQCYESALGARSLANAINSGEVGSLKLAVSHAIDLDLLVPHLTELRRHFDRLQLSFIRGTGAEIVELLKQGKAELAVAAAIEDTWERLDKWPLFTEGFQLAANTTHALAQRDAVAFDDLKQEQLVMRTYCEHAAQLSELMRERDIETSRCHEITCESDLLTLVRAKIGIAIVPRSTSQLQPLARAPIIGLELRRTVCLYGVAGRQRTPIASAIVKMLRAANWSRYSN